MRLERSSRDPFSSCVLSQSISLELSSCRQCGGCSGSTTPPPSPLSKSSLFSGQHEDNPDSLTSIVPPVPVCSRSCHQLHSSFSHLSSAVSVQHTLYKATSRDDSLVSGLLYQGCIGKYGNREYGKGSDVCITLEVLVIDCLWFTQLLKICDDFTCCSRSFPVVGQCLPLSLQCDAGGSV